MQRRAWLATAAATMIGVLAIGSTAGGFGTVTKFGQHAEHEKITRAALACTATGAPQTCFQPKSIFNLAGGPGTFGAVGSPDSDEVFNSDAHCDDADFLDRKGYRQTRSEATTALLACRAHLKRRFREAVTAADRLLTGRFIAKAGV